MTLPFEVPGQLDGFGLNGAIYFEIQGELDQETLPRPEDTLDPLGPVQVVNVTPGSARYGERVPLLFKWKAKKDSYYSAPTLAIRPIYGFPLSEGETWCAVVTRGVVDADGNHLSPAPEFDAALETEPSLAPLLPWLLGSPLLREDVEYEYMISHPDAPPASAVANPSRVRNVGQAKDFLEDDSPYMERRGQGDYWFEMHENNSAGLDVESAIVAAAKRHV